MRTFLLLVLLFTVSCTANAQSGKLGSTARQLSARLGEPHQVRIGDQREAFSSQGSDEVWIYQGGRPNTYFAYGIMDNVVYSRSALVCHATDRETREFVEERIGELERLGWEVEPSSDGGFRLSSPETVYTVDMVSGEEQHCVALWQASWVMSDLDQSEGGREEAAAHLLGFMANQRRSLVAQTSGEAAAENATPAAVKAGIKQVVGVGSEVKNIPTQNPPAAKSTSGEEGGYTWIVASFPNKDVAERLRAAYEQKGYVSLTIKGTRDSKAVYRVGIGRYASQEELEAGRAQLPPEAPSDVWAFRIRDSRNYTSL